MITYNPKPNTELKGVTVTSNGKSYNQDFGYLLNGILSEAGIDDMNGYGQLHGWLGWLSAAEITGAVYLYDTFGDSSFYDLLKPFAYRCTHAPASSI